MECVSHNANLFPSYVNDDALVEEALQGWFLPHVNVTANHGEGDVFEKVPQSFDTYVEFMISNSLWMQSMTGMQYRVGYTLADVIDVPPHLIPSQG